MTAYECERVKKLHFFYCFQQMGTNSPHERKVRNFNSEDSFYNTNKRHVDFAILDQFWAKIIP